MLMKLNRRRNESEDAFTLIELLVVIVIIGLLAAIALPLYFNQQMEALKATVKTDVRNSATAVADYLIKNPTANDVRAGASAEDVTTSGAGFISATVSLAGTVGLKENAHGLANGGGMKLNPSKGNTIEVFGGWPQWRIYGTNQGVEKWVYAYFSNPNHLDVREWSEGKQWIEKESFPELDGSGGGEVPEGWDVGWCADNPGGVAALHAFLAASLEVRFLGNLQSGYEYSNTAARDQIERDYYNTGVYTYIAGNLGISEDELMDMLNTGVLAPGVTEEQMASIGDIADAGRQEAFAEYEDGKVAIQEAREVWTNEVRAPIIEGMKSAYAASGSTLENGTSQLDSNLIQDPAVQAKIREYSEKFYAMPTATKADVDAAVADIIASAPSMCEGPLPGIVY